MDLRRSVDKPTMTKLKKLSSVPKKKPEKLTEKDLAELMGVHRDRYGRKDGALRRK